MEEFIHCGLRNQHLAVDMWDACQHSSPHEPSNGVLRDLKNSRRLRDRVHEGLGGGQLDEIGSEESLDCLLDDLLDALLYR